MILLQAWVSKAYVVEGHVPDGSREELAHLAETGRGLLNQSLLLEEHFLSPLNDVHFVNEDKDLGVGAELLELLDGLVEHVEFGLIDDGDVEYVDEYLHLLEDTIGVAQVELG